MRVVAWNIRAGGGRRQAQIVAQLRRWRPDVIVLSEFRGTEPSCLIADALKKAGWPNQRQTSLPAQPAVNALLVASRWPLRLQRHKRAPSGTTRWLSVKVAGPLKFCVLAVHVPNRVTGTKYPFLESVAQVVADWRGSPAMVIGDTNTGRIGIDEESSAFNQKEEQWMQQMEALRWRDGFRALHPQRREFTWYSPNGDNGFRLDQAFLHPVLMTRVKTVSHRWGGAGRFRSTAMSDHAALLIDFK